MRLDAVHLAPFLTLATPWDITPGPTPWHTTEALVHEMMHVYSIEKSLHTLDPPWLESEVDALVNSRFASPYAIDRHEIAVSAATCHVMILLGQDPATAKEYAIGAMQGNITHAIQGREVDLFERCFKQEATRLRAARLLRYVTRVVQN